MDETATDCFEVKLRQVKSAPKELKKFSLGALSRSFDEGVLMHDIIEDHSLAVTVRPHIYN